MNRRKKGAVRKGHGTMCNICGVNAGKGGALKKHIEGEHKIKYEDYKKCFYPTGKCVVAEAWDDRAKTSKGKTVLIHTLVRRFHGDPGPRGASKAVRRQKSN